MRGVASVGAQGGPPTDAQRAAWAPRGYDDLSTGSNAAAGSAGQAEYGSSPEYWPEYARDGVGAGVGAGRQGPGVGGMKSFGTYLPSGEDPFTKPISGNCGRPGKHGGVICVPFHHYI